MNEHDMLNARPLSHGIDKLDSYNEHEGNFAQDNDKNLSSALMKVH